MKRYSALAGLVLLLICGGALHAEDTLLGKFHPGKKESDVAKDWFETTLPKFVQSNVEQNKFIQTYLVFPGKDRNNKPCEIRDVIKNGFKAYERVPDGQDSSGGIQYRVMKEGVAFSWKQWEPRFVILCYPVQNNRDDADVVALAAWLYSTKEDKLANRVLTVLHERNSALKPLIQAYIIDKEKLSKVEPGQLELYNDWDTEFQTERNLLVTPREKLELFTQREREAKDFVKEIVANRGDYRGSDPTRRSRMPKRLLALVAWDIKEFDKCYGSSEYAKSKPTIDLLADILKSIEEDRKILDLNRKKANDMRLSGKAEDMKKAAQIMELIWKLDPEDMQLMADVAQFWFDYCAPDASGNYCSHEDGARKAIEFYDKILARYPRNTSFLINKGKCYQCQGDGKARDVYKLVIEIDGKGNGNSIMAEGFITNMDNKDKQRSETRDGKKK